MPIRLHESLSRSLRELKPVAARRCLPLLQLRSDGLRPGAHRKFPHLRRQRRHPPAARARVRRRQGEARPQPDRRRRPHHRPDPEGKAAARRDHPKVDRKISRRLRRAQLPAAPRRAHRHRPHPRAGGHDRRADAEGQRLPRRRRLGVFQDVNSFPGYGRLSRIKERELQLGSATPCTPTPTTRRTSADFALWKAYKTDGRRRRQMGRPAGAAAGPAGTSSAAR
jgi:hypothetical protein